MANAILKLERVNRSFGAVVVARDLTFSVSEGEAVGVIGPNGAGKSTLFNLITGNIAPSSGRIGFIGRDVTETSAMQRCVMGIGRSFQIPQPFEKLSVFENLLVANTFGGGRDRFDAARCAEILDRTGLLHRANDLAGSLSLLERKRLELSRALATNPKLLLLDEIAGGLTEGECRSLVETVRSVRAGGTTIVWIEHVLHALTAVVDRLLVLNFGEIIGDGDPQEVMASRQVREIYLGIEA
jgi:branched-chain amino acid transport system ATP-binding protein